MKGCICHLAKWQIYTLSYIKTTFRKKIAFSVHSHDNFLELEIINYVIINYLDELTTNSHEDLQSSDFIQKFEFKCQIISQHLNFFRGFRIIHLIRICRMSFA